jgi:uncharacterized protein involved in exopolysaccharide biosynthesis
MANSDQLARAAAPEDNDALPIAAIGLLLLRRLRLLFITAVVFGVVVVGALLSQQRKFTADTSFVLQGQMGKGGISGIAAQFGLSVPSADASQSPLFFADLAHSRPVLSALADSAPKVMNGKTLETLFDIKPESSQRRRLAAIKELEKALTPTVSTKTGIVEVTLTTPDANASASLLTLLVRTMDRFNRASQQAQAGAQRKFTEERVDATQAELTAAEDRMREFQTRNRVAESPYLNLEADRLRRNVQAAQSLNTTLREAMEQARIEELRNTPIITVLDAPEVPLDPDPRHIGRYAMVAAIFGVIFSSLYVIVSQLGTVRALSAEDASAQFGQTLRSLWSRKPSRIS